MPSPRRALKKELALLRACRTRLPALIDCSRTYGDYTYSSADMDKVNAEIERVEGELENTKT